jgi:hypothetical protein
VEFSLSRELCWFISRVAVGIWCVTYLLTCWSASPKKVWSWHLVVWEPSWFLSVMWCGEAFTVWRFRVSEFWFFLVVFFLPTVAPAPQQNFLFTELRLSASFL